VQLTFQRWSTVRSHLALGLSHMGFDAPAMAIPEITPHSLRTRFLSARASGVESMLASAPNAKFLGGTWSGTVTAEYASSIWLTVWK
jgi:hypothetical protein